jgi:hypothetical protein
VCSGSGLPELQAIRQQPAISRHWIFWPTPAVHFRRFSEAVIGLRVINFSA